MSLIHICNTFFERELETGEKKPLTAWMRSHPAVLQLQFLPLLFAEENERILVSDLPENPDPRLALLDNLLTPDQIRDWGPSPAIQNWAEKHRCTYSIPPINQLREINSKIFSYTQSPRLPGSALLEKKEDVSSWIEKTPGPKVLKTAFGTAGNGHFHVGSSRSLEPFLRAQFDQGLALIGEPWVERVFDFSTQWKAGRLLGAAVFETEEKGTYQATIAGPTETIFGPYLWALKEHLEIARPLVDKIVERGFLGNLGIDAYVYKTDRLRLQPVVEINGRKTMSWAALQIQQKKSPEKALRFSYERSAVGLLPSCLTAGGKKICFPRNLQIVAQNML
jgi:hypothetical protein